MTPSERDQEAGGALWDALFVTPGVELDGDQCDAAINVLAQAIAQARADGAREERAAVKAEWNRALETTRKSSSLYLGQTVVDYEQASLALSAWLEAREGEAT